MVLYNFDRTEVNGTPSYTVEITPTITGDTGIVSYYTEIAQESSDSVPGAGITIGFRITIGGTIRVRPI